MENVYRREEFSRRRKERITKDEKFSLKTFIIKQSMVCGIILTVACSIAASPEDKMVFQKNSIKYILTHNTDICKLPEFFNNFANKYILDEKEEIMEEKSALLDLIAPIRGSVESPFGLRVHPTENVEKFHYGTDIAATEGTKVLCVQKGTAKEVSYSDDYGNYIIVDHGDGITSLYAHLKSTLASNGDEIEAGQMIGESGSTGNVTGPHLHFELKDGENWLDPQEFINFEAGSEE